MDRAEIKEHKVPVTDVLALTAYEVIYGTHSYGVFEHRNTAQYVCDRINDGTIRP